MKKSGLFISVILLTVLISTIPSFADNSNQGRRIIDSLYMSSGRLPINDMVADLEVFSPVDQKGTGTSLALASKDKLIFKKPNKLKLDIIINDPGGSLDGKQMTIIRDGVQCWQYVSAGQYPVKKKPDEPSATLNLPPNIQVYRQDADNTYTVAGKETLDKISATVVKISDKSSGEETKIWVDTKRWVPVKMEKKIPDTKGKGEPQVKTVNYKEFKQLKDGRWFPFALEVQNNGVTERVVVYKAISINVGVEDHLFEPMKKFVK